MKRLIVAAALALMGSVAASAQNYPNHAVTLIVPFAAGGPADITGRMAADILSRALGHQFVVENVGGAGGATGVTRAARATADGYTLVLGHMGTHAAAVALTPNLPYNPVTDFEPIGLVAEYPIVLAVNKALPVKNLAEFVAYAKANESKINMAHAGPGSVSHTACLLLNDAIGIKPTMVPFTGTAPAMTALIAGQVDYVCDPISGPLAHVRAGTVLGLAIAAPKRHPALPDVPTAAEGGLPGFAAAPFYGIFAPKGTPAPIVEKLSAALAAGLDDEAVKKRTIELGGAVPDKDRRGGPALAALVKSEIARLTPILKNAMGK